MVCAVVVVAVLGLLSAAAAAVVGYVWAIRPAGDDLYTVPNVLAGRWTLGLSLGAAACALVATLLGLAT